MAGRDSQNWWQSIVIPESHQALKKSIIPALLDAITDIAKTLRDSHHVSHAGTANAFGDQQLNVDVACETIVRASLASCPAVVTASSEEDPIERPVHARAPSSAAKYTVAFDPLDGSSIIAPNWTVGTIVGIWQGISALSQAPRQQVAAILGVYGPRTTAILALRLPDTEPVCVELGLSDDDGVVMIRDSVRLPSLSSDKTRYFAPANLRAAAEDEAYMGLVAHFIQNKYTLRYSGGLVPDIVHALVKGHGLYLSPVTASSRAKLRRLFELLPIALIIECAGGKAVDPLDGSDILSRAVDECDERGGLLCGNRDEVDFALDRLGPRR